MTRTGTMSFFAFRLDLRAVRLSRDIDVLR